MAEGSHRSESKQVSIDYVRQRWRLNIWRSSLSTQSFVHIPDLVIPWRLPRGWTSIFVQMQGERMWERERDRVRQRQKGGGKRRGEMAWIQKSKVLKKRKPQAQDGVTYVRPPNWGLISNSPNWSFSLQKCSLNRSVRNLLVSTNEVTYHKGPLHPLKEDRVSDT